MKLGLLAVLAAVILVPSLTEGWRGSRCKVDKLGVKHMSRRWPCWYKYKVLKRVICQLLEPKTTASPLTTTSRIIQTSGPMTNVPTTGGQMTNEPMTSGPMTNVSTTGGLMTNEPMTSGPMTNEPTTRGLMTNESMTTGPPVQGSTPERQPTTPQQPDIMSSLPAPNASSPSSSRQKRDVESDDSNSVEEEVDDDDDEDDEDDDDDDDDGDDDNDSNGNNEIDYDDDNDSNDDDSESDEDDETMMTMMPQGNSTISNRKKRSAGRHVGCAVVRPKHVERVLRAVKKKMPRRLRKWIRRICRRYKNCQELFCSCY